MTMFEKLRENRSLIMGLAIFWVAFYHIPWIDRMPLLDMIHDIGYMGVDVFLFISGIGACHSIGSRGGRGYLVQRAKRILPGLLPVLLLWSLVMAAMGVMNFPEFLGSVTLVGWWLGCTKQLNWYFSAVWMYFLLAVVLYRPLVQGKRPLLWVLAGTLVSFLLLRITPFSHQPTAFSRIPVFLLGMLVGRWEKSGAVGEKKLRGLLYGLMVPGILLTVLTWHSWGDIWGDSLGLWWYPFLLVVPGGVFLTAELAHLLRKKKFVPALLRPLEALGAASSEALMIHVGVYKLIQLKMKLYPRHWVLVMLLCLLLGIAYRRLVVKKLPAS